MIRRLKWKFVGITMALLSVMFVLVCTMFVYSTGQSMERDSVSVLLRVIGEEHTPSWRVENRAISLPYFTVLVQPDGSATVLSSQFYSLSDTEQMLEAINASLEQEEDLGFLKDYSLRYLRRPTALGWKIAFADVSYEQITLHRMIRNGALVGAGALAAAFLISLLLARRAVAPVEESINRQRQFIADASHELKTPLTVILSNADLMGEQKREPDDQRRLDCIRSGGGEMQQLIDQMLLLARSDSGEEKNRTMEPVDLSDLADSTAMMLEPAAFENGKQLIYEAIAPHITVMGDRSLLRRLVELLLDNGIKYAGAGGRILLSLSVHDGQALLAVADEGTPIPEGDLENIFHRFYRSDPARTEKGFGLGLAIGRTIAEEHGGSLWAETDGVGMNTFYCTIPLKS